MTEQIMLSKLRKKRVGDGLNTFTCQKYLEWHTQAKEENINWQKLEELALIGESKPTNALQISFKKGTKLLRNYQGKTYQVLVDDGGFLYEGSFYKSLTAIANTITGKKWNGNIFFKCRQHRVSEEGKYGR